ncbi:MAG: sulfite exporter TauE/SafE family protein [Bacteroidales bacterium]|nr:sulfite exporter TauE/SafE family protein [Bacteroidales bacterium]
MSELFFILLFIIAFMYASVGHGGASGYLALMALMGMDPFIMRHSALVLNIFVSLVAFIMFYKGGYFRLKLLWPFIVTSMPMAFLGASLDIYPPLYKIILAICLIIAVLRILIKINSNPDKLNPIPVWAGLITGAAIGLVSGFIGIGGGIILTPVLLLFKWATVKQAAAVSAMFIFLNSISGFIGIQNTFAGIDQQLILMVVVAFTGGLTGSLMGSFRFNYLSLKYILASVLILASIKLMIF